MTLYENYIVYPEGETQEIGHNLSINALVDINGTPLRIPLPTSRMIAYQVFRKHTTEQRGVVTTRYYLELVSAQELEEYT
jgi:hypothetical protein